MRLSTDRYLAVGLVVLIAFVSVVAVAQAYVHYMNGLYHGLDEQASKPDAVVYGPSTATSRVEMRHYSPDGSWTRQCADSGTGLVACFGTWGSLPCRKRSVTGTEGWMTRHWQRRTGCPGSLHG